MTLGEGVVDGSSNNIVPVGKVAPGDGPGESASTVPVIGGSVGEASGGAAVAETISGVSMLGEEVGVPAVIVALAGAEVCVGGVSSGSIRPSAAERRKPGKGKLTRNNPRAATPSVARTCEERVMITPCDPMSR